MDAAVEWVFRGFGLFWIVGGAVTLHKARMAATIDRVLGALSGAPENPLVTRFLFIGAVLTIASGIGLSLTSAWALVPLAALVLSQAVYFLLMHRRFTQAVTDEERQDATVAPSTRNAFVLSVVILLFAVQAVRSGVLTP